MSTTQPNKATLKNVGERQGGLRYGVARAHITGDYWIVRETGNVWPHPGVIKPLYGPFPTEDEALRKLESVRPGTTKQNSERSVPLP